MDKNLALIIERAPFDRGPKPIVADGSGSLSGIAFVPPYLGDSLVVFILASSPSYLFPSVCPAHQIAAMNSRSTFKVGWQSRCTDVFQSDLGFAELLHVRLKTTQISTKYRQTVAGQKPRDGD